MLPRGREPRLLNKILPVPDRQKGWVIGKKGCTIHQIKNKSGANIRTVAEGFVLSGSEMQIQVATVEIQAILSRDSFEKRTEDFQMGSLCVSIPMFAIPHVVGKHGNVLQNIQMETGTIIRKFGHGERDFYIKGNANQQVAAKYKIKQIACNSRRILRGLPSRTSFPFIDDRLVSEQTEFNLQLMSKNPHPSWSGRYFKLLALKEPPTQEGKSGDLDELYGRIRDVLQELYVREDRENLRVDMWCHFGHAFLSNVDETEEDEVYTLHQIKAMLRAKEDAWIAAFHLIRMKVKELEDVLSSEHQVETFTRYEYSFFTPTCRDVRVKVFLRKASESGELSFCQTPPIMVKNVLEHVRSHDATGATYYLCEHPTKHIRIPIFIPHVRYDCQLVIRTTSKNIQRTPEEEEEDKILIEFLNKNIKIKNDKLDLSNNSVVELPDGFDLVYWRRSNRDIFCHTQDDIQFNIKISEEESENMTGTRVGENSEKTNDIHLHCDEWDKNLAEGEWEPESIVKRVPTFLTFVRDVQRNISTEDREEED